MMGKARVSNKQLAYNSLLGCLKSSAAMHVTVSFLKRLELSTLREYMFDTRVQYQSVVPRFDRESPIHLVAVTMSSTEVLFCWTNCSNVVSPLLHSPNFCHQPPQLDSKLESSENHSQVVCNGNAHGASSADAYIPELFEGCLLITNAVLS